MRHSGSARPLAAAALVAATTAVGGLIALPNPFTPGVPFTLQLVGVLLAGPLLGPAWGALSQFAYLLIGAVGLPVFAGAGGLGQLFAVTGGFLWSYPPAALLMGWIVGGRGRPSAARSLVAMLLGILTIYLLGWLGMHLFGGVPLTAATGLALLTFLPGDVLKGLFAAGLARRLRAQTARR